MTDWNDFDRELMDTLADLPPSPEVVAAVTPWREAMTRILWGLFLTTFHLNNLGLQYLLPALGTVLLYLGFRGLRNANRWFRFGWNISVCQAILFYMDSVLKATPLAPSLPLVWKVFVFSLTPLLYLSLWRGLRQAAREVDRVPARDPALLALVWYGVLALIAWRWPNPDMWVFLVVLGLYLAILRSLWGVTKELEDWGYAVRAAVPRVSAGRFRLLYLGTLLAAVLLAAALSSHASPDFRPAEEQTALPEDAAALLLPEDLERLSGAVSCKVLDEDHPLYGSDGDNAHQNQIYAFLMPDGSVQVLHLFRPGDAGGFWKCRLQVTGNARLYDLTCRLFYTKDGQPMTASLTCPDSVPESGLDYFGQRYERHTAAFPVFSWPMCSKDRLVYVIYSADQEANPKTCLDVYVSYGAAHSPAYPYARTPDDDWSAGTSFYYGNGSGLVYKADEDAAS